MDLSVLFYLFPRLAESRSVLSRQVVFDDALRSQNIELKKPLPFKRHSQSIRLIIDTVANDAGWKRFVYEKPDDLVSITGIVDDVNGEPARYPFKWTQLGGGNIDFCADSYAQFTRIEIVCSVNGAYDLAWVCASRSLK